MAKRRIGIARISGDFLKRVIPLPDDCEIIAVRTIPNQPAGLEFIIEGPSMPERGADGLCNTIQLTFQGAVTHKCVGVEIVE